MELVSIIIPCYTDKYLDECLESAYNQTWENKEIILIRDPEGLGTATALNKGIKKSKGKWIKKLDADDILEPYCIEELMKSAKDENTIYYGNYSIINKNGEFIKNFIEPDYSNEEIKQKLLKHHIGNGDTILYHKSIHDKVGYYNEKVRYGEDYEFTLRAVLKHGIKMKKASNLILAKYRIHPESKAAFKARENRHEARRIEIRELVL